MPDAPEDVGRWLALLRDGSPEERQRARTELGLLMEARGLLDEAAEAYARNVADGVQDRRPYERLAHFARQRGDAATEARLLRALADLIAPAPVSDPGIDPVSDTSSGTDTDAPTTTTAASEAAAAAPQADRDDVSAPDTDADNPPLRALPPPAVKSATARLPMARRRLPDSNPTRLLRGRVILLLSGLVTVVLVVAGWMLLRESEQRRVAQEAARIERLEASPVVVSPTPVDLRQISTIASPLPLPSPPALPSPVVVLQPTAVPSPTATPLPARCTDAAVRFPETQDTAAAIRAAFGAYLAGHGVTMDPTSTLFAGLADAYAERHADVVAGWMAVTLQRERRGLPTFPLAEYVGSDVVAPVGAGEYTLRATVSPQGWAEMQAWPVETCEGAFMRHPDNARWVGLMRASVGDVTWALPTPQPAQPRR